MRSTSFGDPKISVAGRGLGALPIPIWAKLARLWCGLSAGCAAAAGLALLGDWSWLRPGAGSVQTLWAAGAALAFLAAFTLFAIPRWPDWALGIRLDSDAASGQMKRVYSGSLTVPQGVALAVCVLGLPALTAVAANELFSSCPLPSETRLERIAAAAPPDTAVPVYFWDYGLTFDPAKLDDYDLLLPYEKGPPQRLLSKIILQNHRSGARALELHGKRPRSYAEAEVLPLFSESRATTALSWDERFESGVTLAALSREAGIDWREMAEAGTGRALVLTRLEHSTGELTRAIGFGWNGGHGETTASPEQTASATPLRFFYWGSTGSVYQVRCGQSGVAATACPFELELKSARFAADPQASLAERKQWTTARLQALLAETQETAPPDADPKLKARRETLLSLYLVSLLTLDPRDPEAYFHLGKLAHNRETIQAAIRYGHDVGLEAAKLAELQALADR